MDTTNASQNSAAPVSQGNNSANRSVESEQALIAAALDESRGEVMQEITSALLATDFFEEAHQNIWRCRSSLADAGVAHDVAAVLDTGKKLGLFLGGPEYVMGLLHDDALKTSSDLALRASAKRVKDFSIMRIFTETLATAQGLALSGTQSHEEVISFVSDSIENLRSANATRNSGPMHVMHYVAGVIDQVILRMDGQVPTNTVPFGFSQIDDLTGGMADGDLIVLAARPSMGKTAISLAIAEAVAKIEDRHVLYFSTEQGGTALAYRLVSSKARIDGTKLRRGELSGDDFNRFDDGAREVGNYHLHIDDTSEITLPEIRARARIFKAKYKKILIVVDYLQRVAPHRVVNDPRIIVGEVSTGLKNTAKELKCPVLALAQLSRGVESRTNKRPMMSDLGESGKIEQDADIIMFLYRDEYYNPDTKEPGVTEVIVSKNRDGAIGVSKLAFEKRTQHFEEYHYGH
ncbi:replicative DNA helicase [Polaromonas sp.]|uniref:replicative DNA helicase n=1 Tax=Polaromonas sp. TaxID=1869339 RepID=UPI00352B4846